MFVDGGNGIFTWGMTNCILIVVSSKFTVTVANLARQLKVHTNVIRAMVDAGYLCTIKMKDTTWPGYRIVKSNPPSRIPPRIIDRASVMLWLLGIDNKYIPVFNFHIEKELMRIAALDEPMRTEQALKMLLRYRDAETIVKAVAKIRSGDVAAVEIQRLNHKYKRKMEKLAGVD